jgi:putative sterol carrier protein
MAEFPSEEWFQSYVEAINASREYAEYAATWEGDAVIHIEAEPDKGIAADVYGLLGLWHGACRGGGIVDQARADAAEFEIRAPYSRWKDVIRGDLEPVKGLVQGKLRVRGDLPKILRYTKGTQELAYIAGEVETTFPDESPHEG